MSGVSAPGGTGAQCARTRRWLVGAAAVVCVMGLRGASELAAQESAPPSRAEGGYASGALRLLVTRAVARNRAAPAGYDARVESDVGVSIVYPDRRVALIGAQQLHAQVIWVRGDSLTQRVMGYRAEQFQVDASLASILRGGWITPFLGGERFRVRQPVAAPSRDGVGRNVLRGIGFVLTQPETAQVVHPLARDRDAYYRYPSADTASVQLPSGETVLALRLQVEPTPKAPAGSTLFVGVLWLELRTLQLVRLRGRIDRVLGGLSRTDARLRGTRDAVAYVDFANGEARGDIRLPSEQRIEFLSYSPALGNERIRSTFRSTFRYDSLRIAGEGGVTPPTTERYTLRFAGGDTLSTYHDWTSSLGARAFDPTLAPFDDLLPGALREDGPPTLRLDAQRTEDVYRYNRVEGLFTGVSLALRLRDVAPGVVARATGGLAWNEKAFRGRVSVSRAIHGTSFVVGAGRVLDETNDFRSPYDSLASGAALLLSQDNYDYIERRYVRSGVERLTSDGNTSLRIEMALVQDRALFRSASQGIIGGPFRPNRGSQDGNYGRVIARFQWRRDVDAELVPVFLGGSLRAEVGDGELRYQRLEGRLVGKRYVGPTTLTGSVFGGVVLGNPPPQQLFEFGEQQNLPAYRYKEFVGNRAAGAKGTAIWRLNMWHAPLGEFAGFVIPAVAPSLVFSVQGVWADLSTTAAQQAAQRLGPLFAPNSLRAIPDASTGGPLMPRATGGVRASVSVGVRLFSNALYLGVGRAVDAHPDTPQALRVLVGFGRQL